MKSSEATDIYAEVTGTATDSKHGALALALGIPKELRAVLGRSYASL